MATKNVVVLNQGFAGPAGPAGATGPQGPAGTSGGGFDPTVLVLEDEFISQIAVATSPQTASIGGYVLRAEGADGTAQYAGNQGGFVAPNNGLGVLKLICAGAAAAGPVSLIGQGQPYMLALNAASGAEVVARLGMGIIDNGSLATVAYGGLLAANTFSGAIYGGLGFRVILSGAVASLVAWANDGLTEVVTATPITLVDSTFYWVKAKITGTNLQLFYSTNGSTWVQVGANASVAALSSEYGPIDVGMIHQKSGGSGQADFVVDYLKISFPYPRTGDTPA